MEPPSRAVKRDTQQAGLIQRYREDLPTRQWARRTVKTYPAEMGSAVRDGKGAKGRMTLLPQSWPQGGAAS